MSKLSKGQRKIARMAMPFDKITGADFKALKMKKQKKVKKKTGFNEPAFAIYDDCMFDKDFMKSKLTRQIFMNGVS